MKYSLQYQYKGPGDQRPQDYVQQDVLTLNAGDAVVIPNVGDSVELMLTRPNEVDVYKVVSRDFSYVGDWCSINIVVTDLDVNDSLARLKE